MRIILDDAGAAMAIADAAHSLRVPLEALIEIDVGQHRGDVAPEGDALLDVARAMARGGIACRGVLAHGGHSYDAVSTNEIARIAEEERSGAVFAAERLRADGHAGEIVSVGSTPTATS